MDLLFKRTLNFLNLRSPRKIVRVEERLQKHETEAIPDSITHVIDVEPAKHSLIDLDRLFPLTDEDYFLDHDRRKNQNVRVKTLRSFTIAGARLISPCGDIITSKSELLYDFSPRNTTGTTHNSLLRRRYPSQKSLTGTALNLVTPFANNYYHWITDALPLLRFRPSFTQKVDWYVVAQRSSYVLRTLELCGVHRDQIVVLSDIEVRCENLIAHNVDPTMHVNPAAVDWLRATFGELLSKAPPARKLYISRDDAGARRVKNESAVRNYLQSQGYETIILSELSVDEQIRAFSSASHLISVHGAGLTNLVFANKNLKLLEIFPPRWSPVCYASVSQHIGITHFYCVADPLGLEDSRVRHNRSWTPRNSEQHYADLTVPLEKLTLFCSL